MSASIDARRAATTVGNNLKKVSGRAWAVTVMLVLFQIVAFADKAVLGLVAPYAIPDLGITPVQFGFIGSAFFFLYSIVSIVTGYLASRISVKWILFSMGVVWAVLQFPMLAGGGAAILLLTRIVLGGAEGPATAMSLTSAHGWFRPEHRALPSNLVAAGSTLGPVFAAPVLAWVIIEWGWRWAFGFLGIVGLVWVVLWVVIGGDGPYAANKRREEPVETMAETLATAGQPEQDEELHHDVDAQRPVNIWAALFSLTFIAAVIGGFSNFWVQGFLTTWLPQYLNGVLGLDMATVGVVTTAPWLVGAGVLLALGFLGQTMMKAGRSVHRSISVPFGLCAIIAGIAFMAVQFTSGGAAVALLAIAGGFSLAFPMTASAVGYAVGPRQRPILMATLGGVASVGAIVSPTLVGYLMTAAGYVAPPKGEPVPADMVANMATGVHQAYLITGIVLLVGGTLAALFLRPEATGRRLQTRHLR